MDPKSITLYEWIIERFTIAGRAEFVEQLAPTFEHLVEPPARVLDLCCGAGPFSFLFERLGAQVTGLDNAPFMIDLARQEAGRRGSAVEFVLADALEHDLGSQLYDLVAFMGNTVSDFPLEAVVRLVEKVEATLRPGGRFVIHYIDGAFSFIEGSYAKEEVEQLEPVKITRRFKTYRAEDSAIVETYRNEGTHEEYDYTSYLYTAPMVRRIVGARLALEQSIRLSERSFVDVFRSPAAPLRPMSQAARSERPHDQVAN